MTRDFLKDDLYFEKFIRDETARIERYSKGIEMVIQQRGEHDKGVRVGYIILTGYHFAKLKALYSAGRPINEVLDFFPDVIKVLEKSWNGENYERMLWMLSIGVMLDIENGQFDRLIGLVRKYNVQDGLLEFLIQGKCQGDKYLRGELLYNRPYAKLAEVIGNQDKKDQLKNLKIYLEKYWYTGHNDSGWYDSHKHPDPIYSGYWSFESGAVAKILGLDDSSLKNVPYYPYDMVHYKETTEGA
ncbi:PoNi-like cognate immunity protein [Edaphobacillus lindanitolerans]|uniref:PoNi C-terminal domain-containing protein n=1 Tax=Edaphobacillus lindanitolerans TaxID=550447 RepID=A0A1U7PPN1_9BACI|nr:PoNi-like cognate immunity protein [Edaphobacillus lindanitolerans]SIT80442.1 protein of unknown function [Edaphobacillus lindanitolerans]